MAKRSKKLTQQDLKLAWFEAFAERHDGRIGPRSLLTEASDPSCPFHDDFEWDDDVAADQHRLAQAAQIIRQWKGHVIKVDDVTKEVNIETTRRVQSPASSRGAGRESYQTIETIMADPDLREDMLRTVLRELMAYRRRYAQLTALADVWAAIDVAVDEHAPTRSRVVAEDRPSM